MHFGMLVGTVIAICLECFLDLTLSLFFLSIYNSGVGNMSFLWPAAPILCTKVPN